MQMNWLTGCWAGIVSKLTLNFRVKRAAARSLRRQRRRGRLFVSTEPMESRLLLSVDTISPSVTSINRASPAESTTSASSVSFTATFSEPVSGVDATDFSVVTTGAVASTQVQVSQVSASVYTVTVSGITGTGSLGVNLADNNSIHDLAGNLLINPNAAASFADQATFATGSSPDLCDGERCERGRQIRPHRRKLQQRQRERVAGERKWDVPGSSHLRHGV